jgi:hypothetical protein
MSTLKTNNLQHLDSGSANIGLAIGGGAIHSGISTFQSGVHVTDGIQVGTGATINGTTNTITTLTNGSERLRIDSAGRVQIGHTTSIVGGRVELHRASAETWMTINESSDTGSGPALYLNRTRGSNLTSPTPVEDGNWLGNVYFGSYDTNSYEIGARIAAASDGQTWADGDCPARLSFYTTPDGSTTPTEKLRIHSDGNVTTPLQCFVFLGTAATALSGSGTIAQDIWGVNSTYVGVDVGGDWDTSTKTFTAPVDGVYHYDWQIRYTEWTGSISYVYQKMYVSGTNARNTGNKLCLWSPSAYNNPAGTQYYTKSMSGVMKMNAGDTVQPEFVVQGSGSMTFNINAGSPTGQCDSYLSIRLAH